MSVDKKILIIGSNGQIGSVLTRELVNMFGSQSVFAMDIQNPSSGFSDCTFLKCSILDKEKLHRIISKYNITDVYLLAAYLSAKGEDDILKSWDLNVTGLMTILELAREKKIKKIFWPSSIAVFGPSTPKHNVDQFAITEPMTIYGVSKLAGENLCNYYYNKFGVDVRSLRYPGLVGWESLPGGGTTDYAVDIFHEAITKNEYTCFLSQDRHLPMMYMDDAIRATLELMSTNLQSINIRTSYNISALHFSPKELENKIKGYFPNFKVNYRVDERDEFAKGWPISINDNHAQNDWNWNPHYNLDQMVDAMIINLNKQII